MTLPANYEMTPTTVTFSLTVKHVGLLSQMSQETGVTKSELVRRAIELLYKRIDEVKSEPIETQNA